MAPSRSAAGFAVAELMLWAGVSVAVFTAATAGYLGSKRCWEGTAKLAEMQRESSLAVEMMARNIRAGSRVDMPAGDNALNVYYAGVAGDTLIASFHVDSNGVLRDASGFALAAGVDSVRFASQDGRVVNIDLYVRDDRGTPNIPSDDISVVMSSTVACRN